MYMQYVDINTDLMIFNSTWQTISIKEEIVFTSFAKKYKHFCMNELNFNLVSFPAV